MPEVFVGIGSNIDPERHVTRAIRELEASFGELRVSPVYRSAAFEMVGADFLNVVAAFDSDLSLDEVERRLTELEADSGRVRSTGVASRTLDLDLLLYGARVDPDRRVPREDVLRYAFVLRPLADLASGRRHPVTGETFASAWQRMAPTAHPLCPAGAVADLEAGL